MPQTVLSTQALTKKYRRFEALKQVSFSLNQGDIYGLIGRNGAGKTTLFKLLMGLSLPTDGTIRIEDSQSHMSLRGGRKTIGFMIGLCFFPYLNAHQNIEYYRRLKGISDKSETDRVLKLVGLYGIKKPFKAFSMGMKQRLGLANALLGSPPVVILDEPINGLDPEGIAEIRKVIKEMNEIQGITFIISSHVLSELDLIATKFGFIDHGELLREISYDDLHRQTQKALIIRTGDSEKALGLLSEQVGGEKCTVGSQGEITVEDCQDNAHELARLLVQNDIALHEMRRQETTLEAYFMELIGGKQHV